MLRFKVWWMHATQNHTSAKISAPPVWHSCLQTVTPWHVSPLWSPTKKMSLSFSLFVFACIARCLSFLWGQPTTVSVSSGRPYMSLWLLRFLLAGLFGVVALTRETLKNISWNISSTRWGEWSRVKWTQFRRSRPRSGPWNKNHHRNDPCSAATFTTGINFSLYEKN